MRIKSKKRAEAAISFFIIGILLFSIVPASAAEVFSDTKSTSVSSFQSAPVQVFNQYSSDYSSLWSGPLISSIEGTEGDFFDLLVAIPPGGCQPAVVRSDLLEEQNVPVFCQLSSVSVNPGVDISRIDKITTRLAEDNPYIAGIGFHPAQAAIRSRSKLLSTPVESNLGYVVVVLKRQETEKNMPDNITASLSAILEYDAANSFGLGQTEFYLPILTDQDFENNYVDYAFWSGIGYLRADYIDDNGASISIYSSGAKKLATVNLAKGKTSDNLYIPLTTGGKSVKIVLKDIDMPEPSARIRVNGEEYEVYKNGVFSDLNCRLTKLESKGGGTGTANVVCEGQRFELEKSFGKIRLDIRGVGLADYEVGQEIKTGSNIYLLYVGAASPKSGESKQTYLITAKFKGKPSSEKLASAIKDLDRQIKKGTAFDKLKIIGADLEKIDSAGKEADGIKFAEIQFNNAKLDSEASDYYKRALDAYEEVIAKYSSENLEGQTYGQNAMCNKFLLANELKQQIDAREFLSTLVDKYPDSTCGDQEVQKLITEQDLYSTEGSTASSDKKNIYLELVKINQPSLADSSVEMTYRIQSTNKFNGGITGNSREVVLGKEETEEIEDNRNTKINLVSFSEDSARLTYSCERDKTAKQSAVSGKTLEIEEGKTTDLTGCDGEITINKINLNKVAKVRLIPNTHGRSRETNFTFSIGVEKRSDFLAPSPDQTKKKIQELNKTIKDWEDANKQLGDVVTGLKGACLATSAALTVKNLFTGLTGESSARRKVMQDVWNQKCQDSAYLTAHSFSSADECLLHDSNIENDVTAMEKIMKDQNKQIKTIESGKDENGKSISSSGLLGVGTNVNTEASKKAYVSYLKTTYGKDNSWVNNINPDDFDYDELKEIESSILASKTGSGFSSEMQGHYSIMLKSYQTRASELYEAKIALENRLGSALEASDVILIKDKKALESPYTKKYLKNYKVDGKGLSATATLNPGDPVAIVAAPDSSKQFLVGLKETGKDTYVIDAQDNVKKIYTIDSSEGTIKLHLYDEKTDGALPNNGNLVFKATDPSSYNNICTNCNEAKFFGLEPYKGKPALIPFDIKKGWYVKTEQLALSSQKTYADSGAPLIYDICNVGTDGLISGGDECHQIYFDRPETYTNVFGLGSTESKNLVMKAKNALLKAQEQMQKNPSRITINGQSLAVKTIEGSVGSKCTDFMSQKDCLIMFNICDPVICPSSRCDLGGQYPVDDVIQSGVIGSVVLCLPNIKEGIIMPVCLTGIHAGIEGWISVLSSYRDCLQENVNTGKMVGICDEIYSVYKCDFFWKQIAPFMKTITQNIFSLMLGEKTHGGGEYSLVKQAFDNAENSFQYFTGTYAVGSKLAFGGKTVSEIGSEVCKMQLSATYPELDTVLEPESPVQINAWFDEMAYTTATVPATSQYKVFYTIFAGNDRGHYYKVYLKGTSSTIGYTGKTSETVDIGYIAQGQTKTETKDFTDISGFRELCVQIDTKDYCGFKSVSTGFALNYAKDKILQDEVTEKVTTQAECVSGSPHIGNMLTPNLQQGVEDTISPDLYNQGIVRVCATKNPGSGVDEARWSEVGYCGATNMKCWVDEQSVKNSIKGKGIENETISQLNKMNSQAIISANKFYKTVEEADADITNLKNEYNSIVNKIEEYNKLTYLNADDTKKLSNFDYNVNELADHLIFNYQKAALIFWKAQVYERIAKALGLVFVQESNAGEEKTVEPSANILAKENEYVALIDLIQARSENKELLVVAKYLAEVESGVKQFNEDGSAYCSSKGACGIMQLTPSAVSQINANLNEIKNDPEKNIEAGIKYLLYIQDKVELNSLFKTASAEDKELAIIAAYNMGYSAFIQVIVDSTSSFDDYNSKLPQETKTYIQEYAILRGYDIDAVANQEQVSAISKLCIDSDDGKNIAVKGTVTDLSSGVISEDECALKGIVDKKRTIYGTNPNYYNGVDDCDTSNCYIIENYCSGDNPEYDITSCKSCSKGICTKT